MFSSIKSRVMIPVLCIFVIFVGYSSIQNYIHAKDYIYTSGTNLISQEINQVNLLIDQKSRTAADLALWISADQEIAAAFANKDREKLLHLLNDTYKDLKTELNINQFQFNLSPATAFLRFHKPDHHGDDLTGIRPTLVEANTTRKPQIGLESGRSGMGIRGVVPVKFHDNHIGTIEFGMAVNDQLLLPLKKKFGFDAAILVPQDGGFSFQAKTFDMRLSEQNISIMKNVLKTGERQSLETEENGKHILTSYGPLRDFAGKNVGIIAIPEDMTELIDSTDRQLLQTSVAALVAVCIVFLIANFIVNRFIKTPLDDFLVFLRSIEKGDYSAQPRHGYKCEMAKLADGLGAMSTSISEAILSAEREKANAHEQAERAQKAMDEARAANEKAERAKAEGMLQAANQLEAVVEVVTSVSEKLSAQIEQSSRGSEEQARRIGETATAMEEMNATVLEVSKNAARAAGTSDDARKKAQDGEATVGDVVKGIALVEEQALKIKQDMGILGQRAESIGQILTVISDIADQTNLLALNAAIEAARAGDAGRGFAVVADEVRKLAEKTMTATKEVGEAIAGIQDGTHDNIDNFDRTARTIDEATALAGISGASLRDIVQLVDRASDQVRSIATAAEEQSASSEEINRSIEQVAAISAETARSMGQAAEAVSDLARQAQVLQAVIARMKSEGGDTAPPASGSSGTARPALADAPRRTHSLAPAPAPVGAARPTAPARPRKAMS